MIAATAALFAAASCSGDRRRGGDGGVVPRLDGGTRDGAARDGTTGDASGRDAGFGYCPGEMPGGFDACRSDSDCECGDCVVGGICGGAGCAAMCGSDSDCKVGWCSGGCCPYCVPPCPKMPCGAGTTCNTATGRCDPDSCDAGYECPTNTRCMPGATGADGHGCLRLTCADDADCECGTCAEGRCWTRPGQCCPPLPG